MGASPSPLRVGIVGAGANTREKHLPGLQRIAGVELIAVCNRSEASSRAVADAFRIARIARRWQEIVEAPDIDAVVIGTWPYLHADVTIAALDHGKHVLTEARMAATLADAQRMLEAARRHPKLVAQVVPAPMSLNVDETVVELLLDGRLGDLREVLAIHTGGQFADSSAPMTWRQDERLSGINMLTLGIMHEMIERWVGEEPRWVVADAAVCTPQRRDPSTGQPQPVKIPETVSVLGRLPGGARLAYHLSGVEAGAARGELRLNGSKGCLRFELATDALFYTAIGGREQPVEIPAQRRRGWRVEDDFVASIRTGAPVRLTSLEQGVRYIAFTDAVWRSWQAGASKIELSG